LTSRVELRAAGAEDEPFLRAVYASTREAELAQVPWDAEQKAAFVAHQFAAQSEHYRAHYDGLSTDVIVVDGERAGRLAVARWPAEIRIVDIALLPDFRGRGVGTGLLRGLLDEAAREGRKLSIHVERENPAARLYRRLGFVPVADVSGGVYRLWEAVPPPPPR
jgi:ribosomal protein S18 acetylase RimI-like enzyme